MQNGIELRIKGKVQGVGFRPFVWLLANRFNLFGDVNNDGQGVLVRFYAPEEKKLTQFLQALQQELPPLAKITALSQRQISASDIPHDEFLIRESENNAMDTQIVPDAATCPDCLRELFDRNNRRYHYPFINCTHCGPRFTIIKAIPYDRPNTSMAAFPFCPQCKNEYQNPADRRFHAQPNACADCGPHIWLSDQTQVLSQYDEAIEQAAQLLKDGKIIAIKGIGGFHLAVDAGNEHAVHILRQRKHRPSKPLAIMVPNLEFLTALSEAEIRLLSSPAAPIVLLAKDKVPHVTEVIAPRLNEIGVMLPSNPLQHLLLHAVNRPLVMTSANPSGEPPVLKNEDAQSKLAGLADNFLFHNRDILQRADDSLVRAAFDGTETLRRARGYVPDETALAQAIEKPILALGADLKNTFCLARNQRAVVSQHIGDTNNELVKKQLIDNLALFRQIYQFAPQAIAVDCHAGYFTHQRGLALADELQVPYVEVLHHHAHIVSVMAEHNLQGQVIGLALDGIGMGENQQLWGGECLLVDDKTCHHLGGLPAVALPGGDRAAVEPWRNFLAHLQQFVPDWQNWMTRRGIDTDWPLLAKAIERKLNCPPISSAGRLFDAVAFALTLAPHKLSWEGEAACILEAQATRSSFARQQLDSTNLPELLRNIRMPLKGNRLDLAIFWQAFLTAEGTPEALAFAFHYALAQGLAELAHNMAQQYQCERIVLSGGVWHNQLLRRLCKQALADLQVFSAHAYPMGDGGLSLGQAVIAAAKLQA